MNPLYQTRKRDLLMSYPVSVPHSGLIKERIRIRPNPRPEIGHITTDSTLSHMLTWRMEAMYLSRGESDHDD